MRDYFQTIAASFNSDTDYVEFGKFYWNITLTLSVPNLLHSAARGPVSDLHLPVRFSHYTKRKAAKKATNYTFTTEVIFKF